MPGEIAVKIAFMATLEPTAKVHGYSCPPN